MYKLFLILAGLALLHCTDPSQRKQAELLSAGTGNWMPEKTLLDIAKDRSVWKHRDDWQPMFRISFAQDNLLSDSALLFGITPHEGGYDAPVRYNATSGLFEGDPSREGHGNWLPLPFELRLADSNTLDIAFPSTGGHVRYRKVQDEYIELRRIMFEGTYTSIKNNQQITFYPDGTISGLEKSSYYRVDLDLGIMGMNFDWLLFFPDSQHTDWETATHWHYAFSGDTLRLYPIQWQEETLEHTIGKVKHILVKRR